MEETSSADFQFRSQLAQVRLDETVSVVDERVKAKNEVNRVVRYHRQRVPVVVINLDARVVTEAAAARFETVGGFLHQPQIVAMVLKVVRPPAETGGDFENCASREPIANPREDHTGPLRCGIPPWFRPFLPAVCPILHEI